MAYDWLILRKQKNFLVSLSVGKKFQKKKNQGIVNKEIQTFWTFGSKISSEGFVLR
jgi:hypothetical protein